MTNDWLQFTVRIRRHISEIFVFNFALQGNLLPGEGIDEVHVLLVVLTFSEHQRRVGQKMFFCVNSRNQSLEVVV